MPIHTLENDDTTREEKEKERKEKKGNTKEQENANQHENEDDEPDTYRASSFARLNRAARDTSLSSFAVGDTNGITLDTYTDLASNCNNSDAQEAAALSTASGAPAPVFTTIITTPASTAPTPAASTPTPTQAAPLVAKSSDKITSIAIGVSSIATTIIVGLISYIGARHISNKLERRREANRSDETYGAGGRS
jgi:hypothetical protein